MLVIRPVPLPDPETVTRVLVGFLKDEVHKAGFERGIVAVSGGLDSAVTLALAARALGAGKVTALLLPHRISSPESTRDGLAVAEAVGCAHEIFEITPMLEGYTRSAGVEDRLRLGNLMARLRMAVLYDRSAQHRALVIGTSNKSELLLGYSTRWGDGANDLNPIGDLYKTQLYPVAAHLGIPEAVRSKAPSADLWEGQTDEGEMGFSYREVDGLLHYLVDEHGTPEGAVREAGFDRGFVDRVVGIVKRSQFKRRMPLIAKVSSRTVGMDFRYPRDWDL